MWGKNAPSCRDTQCTLGYRFAGCTEYDWLQWINSGLNKSWVLGHHGIQNFEKMPFKLMSVLFV
jgi:hypothetical protein